MHSLLLGAFYPYRCSAYVLIFLKFWGYCLLMLLVPEFLVGQMRVQSWKQKVHHDLHPLLIDEGKHIPETKIQDTSGLHTLTPRQFGIAIVDSWCIIVDCFYLNETNWGVSVVHCKYLEKWILDFSSLAAGSNPSSRRWVNQTSRTSSTLGISVSRLAIAELLPLSLSLSLGLPQALSRKL